MIKFLFGLFLLVSSSNALEIKCDFEEVYSDGTVQNGFFLIKNKMLRYQYNNNDLFTLFHKKDQFFLVRNNNLKNIQKLTDNLDVVKELIKISSEYPNIEPEYVKNEMVIKLERQISNNFYKRISINSEKLNMSIYFNECKSIQINKRYFNHNPYFEFKDQ
tara:strand:- start:21 stop:503 length:483 start_codon:yes stop_codon:yes gene_type:complete